MNKLKVIITRNQQPADETQKKNRYNYLIRIKTSNNRDVSHGWVMQESNEVDAILWALRTYRKEKWRVDEKKAQYKWMHINAIRLIL